MSTTGTTEGNDNPGNDHPAGGTPGKPRKSGSAPARYLFMFLLGLVIGAIGTVMALRAIDARKNHLPESVMHVMAAHSSQLKQNIEQNRCAASDLIPHLQTMRTMAHDIEPAFGPAYSDDKRFVKHASHLRAVLNDNLATPPLSCPGATTMLKEIGNACDSCHQDFRS